MIAKLSTLDIPVNELDASRNDYLAFIGQELIDLYGLRGYDYAAAIKYAAISHDDITLDVGCGCAYFPFYIADRVAHSYGIDILGGEHVKFTFPWLQSLSRFVKHFETNVSVVLGNAKHLPFSDNFFTTIFTFSALEHFAKNDDTICTQEVVRCLKPGGKFIGTVDYNAVSEYPQSEHPTSRAYTYKSFIDRIVEPSGLKLDGEDYMANIIVPTSVEYIVLPLFFSLTKEISQ
jgi:ubiquinone/menaquinone biosynthesis C-methylase UbiE